jgi:hypothetical protein
LDASFDKLSKGPGEDATVGLEGEQFNVVHNVDKPQIASRSGKSTATVSSDAPMKTPAIEYQHRRRLVSSGGQN